jgi:hypothetical protein
LRFNAIFMKRLIALSSSAAMDSSLLVEYRKPQCAAALRTSVSNANAFGVIQFRAEYRPPAAECLKETGRTQAAIQATRFHYRACAKSLKKQRN